MAAARRSRDEAPISAHTHPSRVYARICPVRLVYKRSHRSPQGACNSMILHDE